MPIAFDLHDRKSGVLLHPTSLPGPYGAGDIGSEARAFADFLQRAGQSWWQMLPVGPPGQGSSPYSGVSAFAGNPMLVSLDGLVQDGFLRARDVEETIPNDGRAAFQASNELREKALRTAYTNFCGRAGEERDRFEAFCEEAAWWLDDYALFIALRERHEGAAWTAWPVDLRDREPQTMERARVDLDESIAYIKLRQYFFAKQWRGLRGYCAERGIGLIGDIPIFVSHDSADVWAHRPYFRLDAEGHATHVAGVPPDYFSKTGQRWGNPLYRWRRLAKDGFTWWVERFRTLLERFDVVRLDHFIGFSRYWEVPASEPTAEKGRWMKGPGAPLFAAAEKALGTVPFIAEDLGSVTPKVRELRDQFRLPGMRVLQFAFGTDTQASDFLPHAFPRRTVAYTGTHDNDTICGWFHDRGGEGKPRSREQAEKERRACIDYCSGPYMTKDPPEVHWDLIRTVLMSVASTAIVPVQDLLGLGSEARMNTPGEAEGNWAWRLRGGELDDEIGTRLRALTVTYGRCGAHE